MSAREALLRSVYSKLSQNQMEELVDNYAHELAEKTRRHADDSRVKPHLLEGEWTGLRMGANVIDSEVSS